LRSASPVLEAKPAIGYLRVSTREQGRSGLGLAAQRNEIEQFAKRERFAIRSWHQDIQTGAGADALQLRPGLAAGLKQARNARSPLIVARLDRLSRNVHFITGLMEHKVHFIVTALGKDCDHFVLHIYASLAEQERNLISERCKAAAVILKAKGYKFGLARRSKAYRRRVNALGGAALTKLANERAEANRTHIEWALRQPGKNGEPITLTAATNELNERNVQAPMGGPWKVEQVRNMALRLGIHRVPPPLRRDQARSKILKMWKRNREITSLEVIACAGLERKMGRTRTLGLLRECRVASLKKRGAPVRTVDRWSEARLKIRTIWRRHPEFTAEQVTEILGAKYWARVKWVRKTLRQCWLASATPQEKRSGRGRRCYPTWRARTGPAAAARATALAEKFEAARKRRKTVSINIWKSRSLIPSRRLTRRGV
jgi:DNA invertase Pin-like site-specific DNA recombinase